MIAGSASSFAANPPVDLGADDLAALADRRVVVRPELDGPGGSVLAVVDLAAPPTAAIDAILDLPARVGEIRGLAAAEVYTATPTEVGVRWEVRVLGSSTVFHVAYHPDRSTGSIPYALDPTRSPNDLVRAEGAYQVTPIAGGSRIVYRSSSDSGRSVPGWLERWIATDAVTQQLEGIRARAEASR
ncbi:MAG: SRPBCC family protein [Myxococcota bacterium]